MLSLELVGSGGGGGGGDQLDGILRTPIWDMPIHKYPINIVSFSGHFEYRQGGYSGNDLVH